MSISIERSMTCAFCATTFAGYGHGPNGEKQAYREAINSLESHHCVPNPTPEPIPHITGDEWEAIKTAIHRAMADVTITSRKV